MLRDKEASAAHVAHLAKLMWKIKLTRTCPATTSFNATCTRLSLVPTWTTIISMNHFPFVSPLPADFLWWVPVLVTLLMLIINGLKRSLVGNIGWKQNILSDPSFVYRLCLLPESHGMCEEMGLAVICSGRLALQLFIIFNTTSGCHLEFRER